MIPDKLLKYMAAGRPVIAAVHEAREAGRYIHMSNYRVILPPENPPTLVKAVLHLKENPALCRELGANGRRFAECTLSQDHVLGQHQAFFETLEAQSSGRALLRDLMKRPEE